MKSLYILLGTLCLFISPLTFGQLVGINTTNPHPSSLLDIDVSIFPDDQKKGLLLPRIALTATDIAAPVISPIQGLWVYNTQTTTSGTNDVIANKLYMWDGSTWDKYNTLDEILSYLSPRDYYLSAPSNFNMNSTQLSTLNNTTLTATVPIPWENSEVIINNPQYFTKLNDTEFQVLQSGYYDITGFINYIPRISSTSSKTMLRINFEVSTNGGATWTSPVSTLYTFERRATNAHHSISLPFDVLYMDENTRFRITLKKPGGSSNTNHGTNAGIEPTTSGATPRRSLRVTFLSE